MIDSIFPKNLIWKPYDLGSTIGKTYGKQVLFRGINKDTNKVKYMVGYWEQNTDWIGENYYKLDQFISFKWTHYAELE